MCEGGGMREGRGRGGGRDGEKDEWSDGRREGRSEEGRKWEREEVEREDSCNTISFESAANLPRATTPESTLSWTLQE